MNEWISVEDRLPENNKHYLIFNDNCVLFARYKDKAWQDGIWFYRNVTHWMPLPEPPK